MIPKFWGPYDHDYNIGNASIKYVQRSRRLGDVVFCSGRSRWYDNMSESGELTWSYSFCNLISAPRNCPTSFFAILITPHHDELVPSHPLGLTFSHLATPKPPQYRNFPPRQPSHQKSNTSNTKSPIIKTVKAQRKQAKAAKRRRINAEINKLESKQRARPQQRHYQELDEGNQIDRTKTQASKQDH